MPSKTLARISAAQKACIRLHEIGELNDNFVPISHSDASEDEEDSDDDADDDSNIIGDHGAKLPKHVYKRKVNDAVVLEDEFQKAVWYQFYPCISVYVVIELSTCQIFSLTAIWSGPLYVTEV